MGKKREPGFRFKGITSRWFIGSLLWMIVILIIAELAVIYILRDNYYNSARQALEYRLRSTVSSLPAQGQSTPNERHKAAVGLIENFEEKDKFRLVLIDFNGDVIVDSTGYGGIDDEPIDNFSAVIESAGEPVSSVAKNASGDKVASVTMAMPARANNIAAIRIESSLELVDRELMRSAQLLTLVAALILLFSLFSGSYFIRSIVMPVRRIGATAKKIAGGDYAVRVDNRYDDEIGQLCDIINEMAEGLSETDRMKNDFISSVSHELRTPLTSIKGWVETLSAIGPSDQETFDRGAKLIMSETDRLSVLVEDLLDFSRLQSEKLTIEKSQIDLIAELSEAVLIIEQRANRQGIRIKYKEPAGSAPVWADKNRIKQVFVNILDNAVKYSSRKGKITVTAEILSAEVVVSIADNGKGIPQEDLKLVTARFYRAGNAVPGSGIGLAVVDEIVRAHDGRLEIQSELGEGTCVTTAFPLYKPGQGED